MGLPTLYQEKAFSFEKQAKPPIEFQEMLKDRAINVLLKIMEYKLSHSLDHVEDHVYFLEGRTGSGKSTSFPKELFFAFHKNVRVVIPRVNLVQSVPDDICKFEPRLKMGVNIGFYTGPLKNIPVQNPSIRFMTTEIFRQKLLKNAINAPIILIDEVHMLDIPAVNNLKAIKDYLYDQSIPNYKKPLFVFQSATINIKLLSEYFLKKDFEEIQKDWRLIGHVEGTRNFPVEQRYIDLKEEKSMNPENVAKYLVNETIPECEKSTSKLPDGTPAKDILVFVYGKRPIEDLMKGLDEALKSYNKLPYKILDYATNPMEKEVDEWRKANKNKTRILVVPYISGIYSYGHVLLRYNIDPDLEARQNEIKIYLSTEVLEAGKTIDTLYEVFDTGVVNRVFNKPLLYSPFGRQGGTKAPVNQAAVIQRLGRVGRKTPGISTTLYSKETYDKLPKEPDPDNINVVSRADKIGQVSGFIDLLDDNDYISPNSVDTNIRTGQDLIESCLMTPFGVLISDVHKCDNLNTWKLKAKELFYLEGEDLQSALLKSRYSRKNLGNLINTNDIKVEFPMDKFTDMKTNPLRNEVVNSISDARTEYVSFLHTPEKTNYII